jgi:diguanylate cyclase (GGDEF)-like protein
VSSPFRRPQESETLAITVVHGTPADPPRSLVNDILTLQLGITGAIALIALAGLAWTSGALINTNLSDWAERWAGELNELGAPFYLQDTAEGMLDVERFVEKYPEINQVTWFRPDGSVFASVGRSGPVDTEAAPLPAATVIELSEKAGENPPYLLREDIERNRQFRMSGPIWVESFSGDGLFGFDPANLETEVELLGFVAVDLDFSAYQSAFTTRLLLASLVLIALLFAFWTVGRILLKRALRPLQDLEQPLQELAEGNMQVEFPVSEHKEMRTIVTALGDTLRALEKREEHLLHLANHDPLTGLYNRHRLTSELDAEIVSCADGEKWSALCFVDLDQFKYINDTCGHPAGDQLLKLAAGQLRNAVRRRDFVARFGGDEFVVLLKDISHDEAEAIGNQVLEQMRSLSHVAQGHVFHLQCSIGIAAISSNEFNAHELIAQADMACQTAKARGRNRLEFYKLSGKQSERMMQDVRWMRIIRTALENDAFVLHYQPLLHIQSGVVSHYEALLRLQTEQGLIGPRTFLPAATRFGLMADIDRWVIEHAVRALAEFDAGSEGMRLSVNLSSFAFETEWLAEDVSRLLEEYSVDADRLVFEITEQMAVRFAINTDEQVAALRELGCRLAIDDFGTGYSSFSYLKRLPVDYLKIDGSFIAGIVHNHIDQSMVRMVGEMARAAGIETVAEYVQSEAALSLLAEYRIDYAQGYYIGHPHPKPQQLAFAAHTYLRKSREQGQEKVVTIETIEP